MVTVDFKKNDNVINHMYAIQIHENKIRNSYMKKFNKNLDFVG